MSQSTNNSVINFCDVCNLSLETKKGLYRHQSYDLKYKELLEKRLKLKILLKLNPTTISTPELGLNVKNVMKNLEVK